MTTSTRLSGGIKRIGKYAVPPRLVQAITLLFLTSVPAFAQDGGSGGKAGQLMCQAGLGQLLTIGFGLLTILLVVTGVFRIGNGFRKLSDPRSQKKSEGRQGIAGGALAFVGALVVGAAPALLQAIGLSTPQCVSFSAL
ncbi:hypothetical protein DMJ13_19740 [halophilic archaeon]|nr:hypothetical protein DMJ13_19740 [halophilic archaeon]